MKRLRNSSGLPDAKVREIVNWIATELGIAGFDVECRRSQTATLAGRAYSKGSGYHSSPRPFVVLRVGDDMKRVGWERFEGKVRAVLAPRYPAIIQPYQYRQHKGKRYVIANRFEALVYIAAHELRHLWQAARGTDKRKVLPRTHGAKGKFSEVDTEAFAIHSLRQYRVLAQGGQ